MPRAALLVARRLLVVRDLKSKSYPAVVIGQTGTEADVDFDSTHMIGIYAAIEKERWELVTETVVPGKCRRRPPVGLRRRSATTSRREGSSATRSSSRRPRSGETLATRGSGSGRRVAARSRRRSTRPLSDSPVEVLWELESPKGCSWMLGGIEVVFETTSKDGRKKLGRGWIFVSYDDGVRGWLRGDRPTCVNGYKPASWRFKSEENEHDDEEEEDGGDGDDGGDGMLALVGQ